MRGNPSSLRFLVFTVLAPASLVVAIGFALGLAVPGPQAGEPLDASAAKPVPRPEVKRPDGKELFAREWVAGDKRSHRGDGLGPVFNDSSCVACHNLGGAGGGGPANKNVQILTRNVIKRTGRTATIATQSFVLHHFGTDPGFASWRAKTAQGAVMVLGNNPVLTGGPQILRFEQQAQVGGRFFPGNQITQRNTTALFGAGRIDSIDERTLEEAAAKKYPDSRAVTGRVARDEKGIAGRFGWKAQKGSLEDFVLTACAVEVGLHVPGHEQPPMPHKPEYKSPGVDMTKDDCDALVDYVRSLPAPTDLIEKAPPKHGEYLRDGKKLFTSVGCAACHTENLGEVAGIYSDLLIHDMGPGLSDAGSSYGVLRPDSPSSKKKGKSKEKLPKPPKPTDEVVKTGPQSKPPVVATAVEWRTPPLWGVRDSAPYLHDGRANTLKKAIAFHGGEATQSTQKFNALPAEEKQKLIAFLKSLVAPES